MSSPLHYSYKTWQTDDGSLKFYFEFNYDKPYTKPAIVFYIQEPHLQPSPPALLCKGDIDYSTDTIFSCKTSEGEKIKGSFRVLEFDHAVDNNDAGIWADFRYGHNMYKSFNGVMVTFESELDF